MSGRTIGNLILMTRICVVVFIVFMAVRPTIKTRDRLLKRLIAVHGEPRFDLFVPATSSSQLARMTL